MVNDEARAFCVPSPVPGPKRARDKHEKLKLLLFLHGAEGNGKNHHQKSLCIRDQNLLTV